jgi:hypothetical protein
MGDPLATAANTLVEWLQATLRKGTACADDPEEGQFVDPCQFFMETFPDQKSQMELSEAFQDVLKSFGDNPAPITTAGTSDP